MRRPPRPRPGSARMATAALTALAVSACADSTEPVSGPDSTVRPDVTARATGLQTAIAAQNRHNLALLALPGVVGSGIGVGQDGQHEIRVFTVQPGVSGIPATVDGVPVVPVTTGMFIAGDVNDPTSRERPAPNGFSIGHPDITAGTLGAIVTNGTDVFILSNNHVIANSNDANPGDPTLQPGPSDGGTTADQIAVLFDFEPISFSSDNTIDAGIASVSGSDVAAVTPAYAYGAPGTSPVAASVGMGVQKFGRTTGHTFGSVAETNVMVDVCYKPRGLFFCDPDGIARFVNQFAVSDGSFSSGGDSGSLIVTHNSSKSPVGLLFAGSSTRTIANPIGAVLSRFGVSITTDPGSGTGGNNPPGASFTTDCTDLDCSFDGSGSSDSDGSIVSWAWDFGDGNGGSGETVAHPYAAGGTYTVALTVTDNEGATDTSTQDVTVTEPDSGGFTLTATGSKVRGVHTVELNWTGATGTNVDVYRDGAVVETTANDGAFTDTTGNRGSATYDYQVCEAGTLTCSNTVQVIL